MHCNQRHCVQSQYKESFGNASNRQTIEGEQWELCMFSDLHWETWNILVLTYWSISWHKSYVPVKCVFLWSPSGWILLREWRDLLWVSSSPCVKQPGPSPFKNTGLCSVVYTWGPLWPATVQQTDRLWRDIRSTLSLNSEKWFLSAYLSEDTVFTCVSLVQLFIRQFTPTARGWVKL